MLPPALDQAGMMAVADILSQLAFPGRNFRHLFGGRTMLENVLKEIVRLNPSRVREVMENDRSRKTIARVLGTRFGAIDSARLAGLNEVCDPPELDALLDLAVTCPDVDTFVAALPPPTPDPFA